MRIKSLPLLFFFLSLFSHLVIFSSYEGMRADVKRIPERGLTLPPTIVRLMSLEFRSLAADLFFIRASQFYGGKIQRMEDATKEDWNWLYSNLTLITELDPYFQDPYYMGNAFFTWDAHMIDEANSLLMKAAERRSWDWYFPFYIGFNKAYFQGNLKEGAEFLLKAYDRPGAWKGLPTLAARLLQVERQTETAIIFLVKFYENETDPEAKKWIKLRLDAFQQILILEKAVDGYRKEFGSFPTKIADLITAGMIEKVPADPYGGAFYIDDIGRIRTTSKLALAMKNNTASASPPEQP